MKLTRQASNCVVKEVLNHYQKAHINAIAENKMSEKVEAFQYYGLMKLNPGFKHFNCPGALHRARWMSKLLYSIKMDLVSKKIKQELPKGAVFGSGQQQKVKRFVKFFVFNYVSWWLTAPLPAAAPLNDLLLINNLIQYRKVDKPCGDAAVKAL